jgi:hypothetical protein
VSALADSAGAQPRPVRLGEILVERGLVTAEQLELALVDQQTSGELLGAILVARGFVAPTTIAAALATQYGGLLKTEYGFATGFGPATQTPASTPEPAANEVAPLRFSPQLVDAPPAQPEPVQAQVAPPPAEDFRVEDLTKERDKLAGAMTAASAEIDRLAAENAKLAAALVGDRDTWGAEIDRLGAENRTLEIQVAELARDRDGRAAEASADSERLAAENRAMAAKLAELTAERDAARAAPDAGNDGLATRVAELEVLLARVTNRGSTISERLDEVIGDVARLHERLGTDETPSPTRAPGVLDLARPDRVHEHDAA